MRTAVEIIPRRLTQKTLVAPSHSARERKRRLGQVATPRSIADWMTAWACADRPRRILDPAVGEGVFVDTVIDYHRRRGWKRPHIDGCEIDRELASRVTASGDLCAVRHCDFLEADFPRPFDAVIANPPYVRHHAHERAERLFAQFDCLCGARISRMTNLYGLFLLRIGSLLSPRGRAAVIAPAEWLNADFGVPIKRYLLRENAIEAIIHFAHASHVFDGALTTAAIILLRNGRRAGDPIRLAAVDDAESLARLRLDEARGCAPATLDPARKWSSIVETPSETAGASHTLRSVADCSRGIATGANQYFTLNESTRRHWKIDRRDLCLCITKARQITGDRLTATDVRRLVDADERVYLLAPRPRISAAVRRYLDEGRRLGINRRYLPSHRPVWFRPEVRAPAPILVSVFARGRFRFARNEAGVLNLTAYHGIYPRDESPRFVRRLYDYLNSDAAARALASHRRIYGGGLLKLEPRDVESLEIPDCLYDPAFAARR